MVYSRQNATPKGLHESTLRRFYCHSWVWPQTSGNSKLVTENNRDLWTRIGFSGIRERKISNVAKGATPFKAGSKIHERSADSQSIPSRWADRIALVNWSSIERNGGCGDNDDWNAVTYRIRGVTHELREFGINTRRLASKFQGVRRSTGCAVISSDRIFTFKGSW